MALVIYDTLSRKKVPFKPRSEGLIQMFVCGVTPYEDAHIGHGRCYVVFDVVARYLRSLGYNVRYIQNVTDIDDKIIAKASQLSITESEVANKFFDSYKDDMRALKVNSVDAYLPAIKYMAQIIDQVQRLIKKGHAYVIDDGVYFDMASFKDYGKLSKQDLTQLSEHRIEPNLKKKNPGDFSLWKLHKPGEPFWDSPWGKGRPGWHIEDTAITEHEFGPQYDLHGGGIDLIFPHHECEIAQIEAVSGKKPLVNYWMHNEFLRINGVKMSKSLGNWVTIKDALKKFGPEALRYFFLSTHYRTPLNYTDEAIGACKSALDRLHNLMKTLHDIKSTTGTYDPSPALTNARSEFDTAMQDDFEVSKALAALFGLVKEINTHVAELSKESAERVITEMMRYNEILGVIEVKESAIPKEVADLINKREEARKRKDFPLSDKLRDQIKAKGFAVTDSPSGQKVHPL